MNPSKVVHILLNVALKPGCLVVFSELWVNWFPLSSCAHSSLLLLDCRGKIMTLGKGLGRERRNLMAQFCTCNHIASLSYLPLEDCSKLRGAKEKQTNVILNDLPLLKLCKQVDRWARYTPLVFSLFSNCWLWTVTQVCFLEVNWVHLIKEHFDLLLDCHLCLESDALQWLSTG